MNNEKLHSRLRKLLALSERGEGGEKENAKRMLDKMLVRHGLTHDDLIEEKARFRWFNYSDSNDKRLIRQIVAKVTDCHSVESWVPTGKGNHKRFGFNLTDYQFVQFELHYEILKKALDDCLDVAFKAFVKANSIYPESPYDGPEENRRITEKDIQAMQMASAIPKAEINQRIGKDNE